MSVERTLSAKNKLQLHCNCWAWFALVAVILFTVAIRVRLLEVPFERDEGEYAYAGQLMLQGVVPYAQAYNMKVPGVYAVYALFMAVFGQTHSAIHLGLVFINVTTILLLFFLAKRLFGLLAGMGAAATFGLLSLGQSVQGIFANAEHFVIVFALGGILLMVRAVEQQKWVSLLIGALLLGLGFVMKQHGIAFIVFAGGYVILSKFGRDSFRLKSLVTGSLLFLIGVLLPFVIVCIILWWAGVFEKFWFWTFKYAQEYISEVPVSKGLNDLKVRMTEVISSAILLWSLAGIGLISFCWNKQARRHAVFVIALLFCSFLAICPGLYFRNHYFLLLLPAVSLLAGVGVSSVRDLLAQNRSFLEAKVLPIVLAAIVLVYTIHQQRNFFFEMNPTMTSRAVYGANPFPESLEVGRFIKERSAKEDKIAVIGSEPQIYFYSNRRSATGYIYFFALMEAHPYAAQMQEEMIREIESASPKFLVFVNIPTSLHVRAGSEKWIFKWFQQYCYKYYRKVGVIDIISMHERIYRWDDEALEYLPKAPGWLAIYERKD
jgi:hypothetical protein